MLPAIVWVTGVKSCDLYQIPEASEQYTYSVIFCTAGGALVYKFEKYMMQLVQIIHKVIELTNEYKKDIKK